MENSETDQGNSREANLDDQVNLEGQANLYGLPKKWSYHRINLGNVLETYHLRKSYSEKNLEG